MMTTTGLNAWRDGHKEMTVAEAAELLGQTPEDTFPVHTKAVRIMPCGMFICAIGDGWFWTIIERSEYVGDWKSVSARAYFDWSVSEMTYRFSRGTNDLCVLLEEWCEWKGVPYSASVEEMIVDPRVIAGSALEQAERLAFLEWFLREWDAAVAREGGAA